MKSAAQPENRNELHGEAALYPVAVNVVTLVIGVVSATAGIVLIVSARRRRLDSIARGEDPGKNISAGVGAALLGVGLLSIARSF